MLLISKLNLNVDAPKVGELYRVLDAIEASSNTIIILENVYSDLDNWQDFLLVPDDEFMTISDANAESLRLEFENGL